MYWATVYRPPGHHTDFIKEFTDFLSELVLAADKVLFVGDFNIHVDNEKDALGSAFIDILQQSDDISDHYLVLTKLHIAKAVNSTPCYKYGRTITSTRKDYL